MSKLAANQVFTPGDFPTHTYVERSQLVLEQRLAPWLSNSTLVALVSGPSKAGKTSLIRKVVGEEHLITVSGASIRSADQLWDRVLDWIGEPVSMTASHTHTDTRSQGIEGTTGAGFPGVASFQAKGTESSGTSVRNLRQLQWVG